MWDGSRNRMWGRVNSKEEQISSDCTEVKGQILEVVTNSVCLVCVFAASTEVSSRGVLWRGLPTSRGKHSRDYTQRWDGAAHARTRQHSWPCPLTWHDLDNQGSKQGYRELGSPGEGYVSLEGHTKCVFSKISVGLDIILRKEYNSRLILRYCSKHSNIRFHFIKKLKKILTI